MYNIVKFFEGAKENSVPLSLKSPAPPRERDSADVSEVVARVIADVADRGDDAVREYSTKFDSWTPDSFRLSAEDGPRWAAWSTRHETARLVPEPSPVSR
jgi:histidinol dehydrogenase